MTREELAAQLFAFHYAKPSDRNSWGYHMSPKQCFKAADHFLKYAAKEQEKAGEQEKAPPCQKCGGSLNYTVTGSPYIRCARCHYIVVAKGPEDTATSTVEVKEKPKRVAREWECWLTPAGDLFRAKDILTNPQWRKIKVVEILPEE